MTVKELIDKLQAYPSDMLVAINYTIEEEDDDIRIIKDFAIGDSANPNAEIIDEVLMIGW